MPTAERRMHRFYFHLYEDGASIRDEEGRELNSFEEAYEEAVFAARALMAVDVAMGYACLSCHIEVTDTYGTILADVAFPEAVSVQS